jgi:exosortase/archaeosortase
MLVAPPLQRRVVAAVDQAAVVHSGHVFTVGHGYKLLDEGYYVTPGNPQYDLTPGEAARYVVRAVAAYVIVPLPWQIGTRGELTYLPEQLLWYALLILAPIGTAVALKRDRVTASLLVAYVLPTAAVVALTTGNVGTLIRHRTLIVPYLVWLSALGFAALLRPRSPQRRSVRLPPSRTASADHRSLGGGGQADPGHVRLKPDTTYQTSDVEVERLVQGSVTVRAVRALLTKIDAIARGSAILRAVSHPLSRRSQALLIAAASLTHLAIVAFVPVAQAPAGRYLFGVGGLLTSAAILAAARRRSA